MGLEAEEYDRSYRDRDLFRRILSYFRPQIKPMIMVIAFLTLDSITTAVVPILSANLINTLITTSDTVFLILVISIIFTLNVISYVFNYFLQKYSARTIGDVILNLRHDATEAAINRDLSFFDKNPIGNIVSRINNDSRDFGDGVSLTIEFISSLLVIIIIAVYMVPINLILSITFLATIPLFFIVTIIYRKIARRATLLGQRATAQVNTFFQETLSGIQIAKTFRQEAKLYNDFNAINKCAYKVNLKRGYILNFIFPSLNIVQGIILTLIIYFGGSALLNGQVSAGDLYLFLQGLWLLFYPLFVIAAFWPQFQSALSAAERIFAIVDTPSVIVQDDKVQPDRLRGEITFQNVTFQYDNTTKVLDDFSLTIHPGETLAIVGHTGAGKSTIAKLITRFYEFQKGDILIDGFNIRKFDLPAYRKLIGYIPQTPFLWADSIENNIRTKESDTKEQIIWALDQAGGSDWIDDLGSEGLNTNAGERGNLLSVGQRQLVALARVLLENPAIIILDEATASIDPFTETRIQDALEKVFQNRTSIIIAHRLWTVRKADRIIVLDHGKIAEEGNHEALMANGRIYATLYNTYFRHQSLEYIKKCKKI
ncbi:MAG: ABC transporter ATP-binding protein/permease [Candidatus Helarchaeota archaeon]|nr:ABC transporter ATP-binding protein/permease [Candidatus Helarchaeota archaeon]